MSMLLSSPFYLCLSLYIFFTSLSPQTVKANERPLVSAPALGFFTKGRAFPGHCPPLVLWRGSVGFPLIVQRCFETPLDVTRRCTSKSWLTDSNDLTIEKAFLGGLRQMIGLNEEGTRILITDSQAQPCADLSNMLR